jgi:hypothetical protein
MKGAICILCPLFLLAPPAGRDAGSLSAVTPIVQGSASVSGMVVSADATPQPLRRVIVTLSGSDLAVGRSAITDDSGRFSIEHLPAGRFSLSAKKAAYLPGAYGANRPGRPGITVTLSVNQQLAGLTIVLMHGAAMSGVVHDLKSRVLANAQISVMRIASSGALSVAGTATSDDRGHYRVFGLAPSDYLISATQSSLVQTVAGAMTTAEVDATLDALRRGRAGGSVVPPLASLPPVRTINLAPVFYPGVLSPGQATLIRLAAGDDRAGIDITMQLGRTATVMGTLVGQGGPAPNVSLSLIVGGISRPSFSTAIISQTRPSADGTFKFTSVNPGSYVVEARSLSPTGGHGDPSGPQLLWGRAEVEVNGDDVSGVGLVLRPTLRLKGRLVFDGTSTTPADLTALRINVIGAADESTRRRAELGLAAPVALPGAAGLVHADGTFDVDGITPGLFTVDVMPMPMGWSLRSAMIADKDVLDTPFEVREDATVLPPSLLTLTDRHASLSGTIQTSAASGPSTYFIIIFPKDRALWRLGSRRIRATRADTNGNYVAADLPAGDYLIAALADFEPDDLLDLAFFDKLVPSATMIHLAQGERKTQDLRIGG